MSHERGKRRAPGKKDPGGKPEAKKAVPSAGRSVTGLWIRSFLSLGIVAAFWAGESGPSNWVWGMNLLRYYPQSLRLLWTALALGAVWLLPEERPRAVRPAEEAGGKPPARPIVAALVAATAAAVLFNLFRTVSLLLGDGMEIVRRLHQGNVPAPRSPLYNMIEPVFFRAFSGGDSKAEGLAAGVLSVLAGTVGVGVAVFFLARIARRDRAGALTAGALLLLTGALQLFFGYIEVYPLLTASTLVFYAAAFDRLTGGDILGTWAATGALLVGLAAHPFGVTLVPGWFYLASLVRKDGGITIDRRRLGLGLLAGVAAAVVLTLVFAFRPELRHVGGAFRFFAPQELVKGFAKTVLSLNAARPWADRYRVFSLVHLADCWNTLWIVGAAGFCFTLALLFDRGARKALSRPPVMLALLSLAGIVTLRAVFRTPLGAMRDWDLFSGLGLGTAALAAALALVSPARLVFRPVLAAALFFLAPWIGIQTSNERAASRHFDGIEAEPRPEPTVAAYFHCVMGDRFATLRRYDLATRAYRRALDDYPRYEFAWRLGTVQLVSKEFPGAIEAFKKALELSPGDRTTLVVLAEAYMGAGDLAAAKSSLDEVLAKNPGEGLAHLRYAQIDLQEGRIADAEKHMELADRNLGPDRGAARKELEDLRAKTRPAN